MPVFGYLAVEKRAGDAEAQALGYEYASRGYRYGLSATEAVGAFLFFRKFYRNVFRSPISFPNLQHLVHYLLRIIICFQLFGGR